MEQEECWRKPGRELQEEEEDREEEEKEEGRMQVLAEMDPPWTLRIGG